MKDPFIRRLSNTPVSFRRRRLVRLGILILTLVIIIATLNELRCMKYGCVSRVGLSGARETASKGDNGGEFVGGGSVLPVNWASGLGDMKEVDGGGMPLQTPGGDETEGEVGDENGEYKFHDGVGDGGDYDGSVYTAAVEKAYPVGS
jgi:hypothetical protein